ncbi:hypothetical protein [Pseudofrankia inefficax]|nr:hypothetical protein [Pseudofrankia inefficax]
MSEIALGEGRQDFQIREEFGREEAAGRPRFGNYVGQAVLLVDGPSGS